jgi:hypothetical protein
MDSAGSGIETTSTRGGRLACLGAPEQGESDLHLAWAVHAFGTLLQKGLAAQSDDGRSLRIVTTRIGLRS